MSRHSNATNETNVYNGPDYQPRHAAPEQPPAGSDLPARGLNITDQAQQAWDNAVHRVFGEQP